MTNTCKSCKGHGFIYRAETNTYHHCDGTGIVYLPKTNTYKSCKNIEPQDI